MIDPVLLRKCLILKDLNKVDPLYFKSNTKVTPKYIPGPFLAEALVIG